MSIMRFSSAFFSLLFLVLSPALAEHIASDPAEKTLTIWFDVFRNDRELLILTVVLLLLLLVFAACLIRYAILSIRIKRLKVQK